MNPEEVIERLKTIFAFGISNCIADKIARDTTFAALEKQVPKSYDIRCNASGVCYDCPECGVKIDRYDKYCFNCGQKIDWED